MHVVGLQPQSDPFPTPPKRGAIIYDRSGVEFEFDRVLSDTEWLCYTMMESQGWEGERELFRSDAAIILSPKGLYPKPPLRVVTQDLDEKVRELEEITEKLRTARADLRQFEQEAKAREERILRHEKLSILDDWMGGKITCLVHLEKSGGFRVVPISEELDTGGYHGGYGNSNKKKLKLLTLWGQTDGDLQWRIGAYTDNSGSSYEVMPFASEDDARAWLKAHLEQAVSLWDGKRRDAGGYDIFKVAAGFIDNGFAIPDAVVDYMRLHHIASAQQNVDKARQAFEAAAQKLLEARRS